MSKSYYDENAERFVSDTVNVDMRDFYEKFLQNVPEGGLILDAGCGSGRDSLAFKAMGYAVHAFDASAAMVSVTRNLAKIPTSQMTFQNCKFDIMFDGIWACASLLHVPRSELSMVFLNLASALRSEGIIYASFKYGTKERDKGDRYFNDLNEQSLQETIGGLSCLEIVETWTTGDLRVGRSDEKWLNCIIRKVA
jgi:2-polyprenyl-3-methyl-5-hydroxy-6-metoxy-1,4-benzoquinol methylase